MRLKGMMFGWRMRCRRILGRLWRRTLPRCDWCGAAWAQWLPRLREMSVEQDKHATTLFSLISLGHTSNLEAFWKEVRRRREFPQPSQPADADSLRRRRTVSPPISSSTRPSPPPRHHSPSLSTHHLTPVSSSVFTTTAPP